MNEYEFKAVFLDDDGSALESQIFTIKANSVEDAYDLLEEEILDNNIQYPSDEYDAELIDVY